MIKERSWNLSLMTRFSTSSYLLKLNLSTHLTYLFTYLLVILIDEKKRIFSRSFLVALRSSQVRLWVGAHSIPRFRRGDYLYPCPYPVGYSQWKRVSPIFFSYDPPRLFGRTSFRVTRGASGDVLRTSSLLF